MEWMNRGARASQPAGQTITPGPSPGGQPTHHGAPSGKRKVVDPTHPAFRILFVTLLFSGTILVLAAIGSLMFSKSNSEDRYVDNSKMQAVFLNGGQVYFGKIGALNNKYVGLTDIYYLRVNQQVQPKQGQSAQQQDISLVKLGCELHGPEDQMLINREQVIFWENLKDDGQVAKAVADYRKQNPNGQKCETPQQTGSNNNSNSTTDDSTATNPADSDTANTNDTSDAAETPTTP